MTIANRMWKHIFGIGGKEPVTDLDDPNSLVARFRVQHPLHVAQWRIQTNQPPQSWQEIASNIRSEGALTWLDRIKFFLAAKEKGLE